MRERNRWYRFKNSRFCAVYGCYNRLREKRSLYPFPYQKNLRQAWILATGREGFVPTESSRVCADHFQVKDFKRYPRSRYIKGFRMLKKGAVPTVFDNSCNERPFPRYSKKVKFNSLTMPNDTPETQAVRNDPSSSFQYPQDVGVTEHPLVKQEVLSDEESPSADTTNPSIVSFLPLKELITKLRSNVPQPSPSIKVEPAISEQLPDPTPFSPVITNVGPVMVKPDPDGPNTNQFPSAHSSHESVDPNQFPSAHSSHESVDPNQFDSFVASSLVDCQLGDDSFPTENSLSLRNDASSSSSSAREEFELCDKCGSYTRKVHSATERKVHSATERKVHSTTERKVHLATELPKSSVHQHQSNPVPPPKLPKIKDCPSSCSMFCCDDSMCSMSNRPVDPRLAKYQAYGQVLAQRLHRLPAKTSSLVQSVIEELVFNAEDGLYDGYLSTKGVLKKRASVRSLKQIGGFNGYED